MKKFLTAGVAYRMTGAGSQPRVDWVDVGAPPLREGDRADRRRVQGAEQDTSPRPETKRPMRRRLDSDEVVISPQSRWGVGGSCSAPSHPVGGEAGGAGEGDGRRRGRRVEGAGAGAGAAPSSVGRTQ
jgi:hypothetical protein